MTFLLCKTCRARLRRGNLELNPRIAGIECCQSCGVEVLHTLPTSVLKRQAWAERVALLPETEQLLKATDWVETVPEASETRAGLQAERESATFRKKREPELWALYREKKLTGKQLIDKLLDECSIFLWYNPDHEPDTSNYSEADRGDSPSEREIGEDQDFDDRVFDD